MPPLRLARKRTLVFVTLGVLLPTAYLVYRSVRLQQESLGFQNRILEEYARYSVDYAVAEVQDLIRAREREVHMHYRMLAMLQEFEPGTELGRIEHTYPLIEHAFLMRRDRSVAFAGDGPTGAGSGSGSGAAPLAASGPGDASPAALARTAAAAILVRVLDAETYEHLLHSGDPHFFRGHDQGAPFRLTAFGLFHADGSPYGVAGFFLNLPHVRQKLLGSLLAQAIDTAEGRLPPDFGRDLTFVVYDHNGQRVYVHQRPGQRTLPDPKTFLATAELWDVLPGWTVRLVYSDPKGGKYQRDIWVANTLLLLLVGAIAVVGAMLVMRYMMRQVELANMKSHFVSNITHELKTPLAAIRLYTETLEQGRVQDPEQERRFLGIIQKESARLAHLIHNILDFSRIDSGQRRYSFEPASVADVVRDVVEAYGYHLRAQGFELRLEVEPDLPDVWIDHDALRGAVLNLLDNAAKYARARQEIEVRVLRAAGGRHAATAAGAGDAARAGAVEIRVRDHGIGIPPRETEKIFEAFYRVEKGLDQEVQGAGLGLALVKHIVEAHGGAVAVESRPGEGSEFTIRLPVGPRPPVKSARNNSPLRRENRHSRAASGRKE